MSSIPTDAASSQDAIDAFAERIFQSTLGFVDIANCYLGQQLGLYQALAGHDAGRTTGELAATLGLNDRYLREWLEQQTVTGILTVDDPTLPTADRRFALPSAHAAVLADVDHLAYLGTLPQLILGLITPLDELLDAFRTGAGVDFAAYGRNLRDGQAGLNRNLFLQQLGTEYLPAIPMIEDRLRANPPARIADIGCGLGYSAIGMARAYPGVHVDGFDVDAASVAAGQAVVAQAIDVFDRVSIAERDAADLAFQGQYDLATAYECVHDMSDPVGVLSAMRSLLKPGGVVLIMDEKVGDHFTGEFDDIERFMYGCSVLHCLPVGLVDPPAAGTGTVMRFDTLRGYAEAAGFRQTERLPLENFFFNFYLLTP